LFSKSLGVREVHIDIAHFHGGAWNFRTKTQGHALIRLHANHYSVSAQRRGLTAIERLMRSGLKDQGNLGDSTSQTLTSAQVKRHACPAAGVYFERAGSIGLGGRFRIESFFLTQALDVLRSLPSSSILSTRGGLCQRVDRGGGLQDLNFLRLQR